MVPRKTVIYDANKKLAIELFDKLLEHFGYHEDFGYQIGVIAIDPNAEDPKVDLMNEIDGDNVACVVLNMDTNNKDVAEAAKEKGIYVCAIYQNASPLDMAMLEGNGIINEHCRKDGVVEKIAAIVKRAYEPPQ